MPYFNSLLEYWLLGTIFFYHKDVINIQLVHNLFTHSKTLYSQKFRLLLCQQPVSANKTPCGIFKCKGLKQKNKKVVTVQSQKNISQNPLYMV